MSTAGYYPTDMTAAQWTRLLPLLPARKWQAGGPGRPPCELRGVLKGSLYLLKTGCQGRMLPREFGKWNTVYSYCNRWREAGVWAPRLEALRPLARRRQGRQPEPSAGRVESQSLKTAPQAPEGGFAGGKPVKGRKRPLVVDPLGLLSAGGVTAANPEDRLGLRALLTRSFIGGGKRLRTLWVEGGSQAEGLAQGVRDLKPTQTLDLEITGKAGTGFQGIPWRWAVERTFAWLLNDRRHSRDYERLTRNSEAMIQLSMIRLLLNRLA
jgi:putative transposase